MSSQALNTSVRYCGRFFTAKEIKQIKKLISDNPQLNRAQLSRRVCDMLAWLRPDGRLKDMSCRVAMLRMYRDGLIILPKPQKGNANGRNRPPLTSASDPREPISLPAGALGQLHFRPVNTPSDSSLWNQLIQRYHYLGYKPLPGAQIRFLVFSQNHLLAALGFSAAAWSIAPRDQFIGWTNKQRVSNLHLVVNNSRFLILPWITSANLASKILASASKLLPQLWQKRYGYSPVLLETFVQKNRFHGTCYRAANWIHVGVTQGRGKLDRYNLYNLPLKDIFLYPLSKNFRKKLLANP